MSDPYISPVRRVYEVRPAKPQDKADGVIAAALPSVSPAGARKLIRPRLSVDGSAARYQARLSTTLSAHSTPSRWSPSATPGESSHAEAFYFQKQIHSHTPMIFVLEDGEQIAGTIEWYDRNAIKVRRGNLRTLIYKSGIKYLYKATDNSKA